MGVRSDVIVIGGGLAGLMSGLAAARTGATVHVISASESTLRQASGLIDVLGYPRADSSAVANPFDALNDLPPEHPYHLVDEQGVRAGLTLFDQTVGSAYAGEHTDRNALVPTLGGTIKPTARYPATVADGLASDERPMLLVGFDAIPEFDAQLVAARLRDVHVPFDVRGVTIPFPKAFTSDAALTRYARALDDGEDSGIWEVLAGRVRPHLEGENRVGFPAILGLERPSKVTSSLADALGAPVFEVPMGPPSLPGMRLQRLLESAFRALDGNLVAGSPVVDFVADDRRIDSIVLDRSGSRVPYDANQYVLATGGLVGSGIVGTRQGANEPLFDCHVDHPTDRNDWYGDNAFGPHRFARFGVHPDDDLRPREPDGTATFENLRAAGAVIAGADLAREKSGSGISIATGVKAGTLAATDATGRYRS